MTRFLYMLLHSEFIVLLYLSSSYTIEIKKQCERHQGVITRHCMKQCHSDSNCVSPRKKCLCDGDCGRSCINKNLRCKRLPNLPHGKIDTIPFNQFGAVAKYQCDDGYKLHGQSARVCQGDEQWSHEDPSCVLDNSDEQLECLQPPVVHNAQHDGGVHDKYPVGKQLLYKCNKGFVASPEKAIVTAWCVGNSGIWVGPKMTCTHAGCPLLQNIDNGHVNIMPPNIIGSKAIYTCEDGYHLAGRVKRVCLSSGLWEGVEPSCERVACGEPPTLADAEHSGDTGQVTFPSGKQIVYTCNFGFVEDFGTKSKRSHIQTMCSSEGRWTELAGACIPVVCGDPREIRNGWHEGFVYKYPSVVVYHCKTGYELVGRSTRKCLPNGSWSGQRPMCKAVVCLPLSAPEWGKLEMDEPDNRFGNRAKFSCITNFRVVGSSERRCMADGTWSGQGVICQEINCGLPPPIYNGYFDGHKTTVNAIIKFRCNVRTRFEGGDFSTECGDDGKWSQPTPKCWGQCQVPSISNGSVNGGKELAWVDHRTKVTYRCLDGLVLDYPDPIECVNGTWSHQPRCRPAPCQEPPPKVHNGRRIFMGSRHTDRAKYMCLPGYRIRGSVYLKCLYGTWIGDGSKTACVEINCKNPGMLGNGTVYKRGTVGKFEFVSYIKTIRHGTRLTYECHDGFARVGPEGATCVDGVWRPKEKPYCKPSRHLVYQPRWHIYRTWAGVGGHIDAV